MAELFANHETERETEESHEYEQDGLLERVIQVSTPRAFATAQRCEIRRNITQIERQLMAEAERAGEAFYYGWGAGKNAVCGPSQELAYTLARLWGNNTVLPEPLQETADAWIFTYTFTDLETGGTTSRQFRQSKKWTIYGKIDAERADDMRFQIGQSKAARNVIFKGIGCSWLVDAAIDRAKRGVRAKIEKYVEQHGLAKAVDMVLAAMAKEGVGETAVFARFGVAAVNGITIEHLVTLRGDLKALQDGDERASELYPDSGKSPVNDKLGTPPESPKKKARDRSPEKPIEPIATSTNYATPEGKAEAKAAINRDLNPLESKPTETAKPEPLEQLWIDTKGKINAFKLDALAGIENWLMSDECPLPLDRAQEASRMIEARREKARKAT